MNQFKLYRSTFLHVVLRIEGLISFIYSAKDTERANSNIAVFPYCCCVICYNIQVSTFEIGKNFNAIWPNILTLDHIIKLRALIVFKIGSIRYFSILSVLRWVISNIELEAMTAIQRRIRIFVDSFRTCCLHVLDQENAMNHKILF